MDFTMEIMEYIACEMETLKKLDQKLLMMRSNVVENPQKPQARLYI